jgi:hypothetical protein
MAEKAHSQGSTHFPKVITLNVGGRRFTTTLKTLTKNPNTMLAQMFSGSFAVETDRDGNYFIDRDGTHFRYILNFLRDGSCNFPNHVAKELLAEARYYKIDELVKYILQTFPEATFDSSEACRLEKIALSQARDSYCKEIAMLTEFFLNEFRTNAQKGHVSFVVMIDKTKQKEHLKSFDNPSIRAVVLKDLEMMGFKPILITYFASTGFTKPKVYRYITSWSLIDGQKNLTTQRNKELEFHLRRFADSLTPDWYSKEITNLT